MKTQELVLTDTNKTDPKSKFSKELSNLIKFYQQLQ